MGDLLSTIDIGRKLGALPLLGRGAGSPSNTMSLGSLQAYLHTKWHLDPSSRLSRIDIGRKLGAVPPFWKGELGPHLAQCCMGRGLPTYQVASWSIQPFGQNRHVPKIGGSVPLLGGGAGSPSTTMWRRLGRGLPSYQVASWSIEPFGHNTPTSHADRRDS